MKTKNTHLANIKRTRPQLGQHLAHFDNFELFDAFCVGRKNGNLGCSRAKTDGLPKNY